MGRRKKTKATAPTQAVAKGVVGKHISKRSRAQHPAPRATRVADETSPPETIAQTVTRLTEHMRAPLAGLPSTCTKSAGAGLQGLHAEIVRFASRATPSEAELKRLALAIGDMQHAIRPSFPRARFQIFGSQATGLQLPASDVDVVVSLNVSESGVPGASGFSQRFVRLTSSSAHAGTEGCGMESVTDFSNNEKKDVVRALRVIQKLLMQKLSSRKRADATSQDTEKIQRTRIVKSMIIKHARVPLIKLTVAVQGQQRPINMDISIGANNGLVAIRTVRGFVRAHAALRPLTLLFKAILRSRGSVEGGLNETFSGGIGSYVLVNMVCAFLLGAQTQDNFGRLFVDMLRHYASLDYNKWTISVRSGGLCSRLAPPPNPQRATGGKRKRAKSSTGPAISLSVEDPQEEGREMGLSSYRMGEVRGELVKILKVLRGETSREPTADAPVSKKPRNATWADVQRDGSHTIDGVFDQLKNSSGFPTLGKILDVEQALTGSAETDLPRGKAQNGAHERHHAKNGQGQHRVHDRGSRQPARQKRGGTPRGKVRLGYKRKVIVVKR